MTTRRFVAISVGAGAVVVSAVALAGAMQQSSLQYNVYYTCNKERLIVSRCANETDEAFCSVSYPDRKGPATNNLTPTLAEKRGDLIKRLQACGALTVPKPGATAATPAAAGQVSPAMAQQADALKAQGDKLDDEGDREGAIDAYQRSIQLRPSAGAYNNMGNSLNALGRHKEAAIAFQQAIKLAPAAAIPWDGLADAYAFQDLFAEAIAARNESLRLDPKKPEYWSSLSDVYVAAGQFENAIVAFQSALKLKPNDAQTLSDLGRALVLAGRPDQARRVHQQLVAIEKRLAEYLMDDITNPKGIPGVLIWYGDLSAMAGGDAFSDGRPLDAALHDMLARGAFRNALRLKPANVGVLSDIAHGLSRVRLPRESIPVFQAIIAAKPDAATTAAAYWGLGSAYNDLKEPLRAVEALKAAQKLKPDHLYSSELGESYLQLKQYPDALAAFQDALKLETASPGLLGGYRHQIDIGRTLALMGQSDRAIAAFAQASKLQPKFSEPHAAVGSVYLGQKNYPAALGSYSMAVRLDPKDAEAQFGLARTYLGVGRRLDAAALVPVLKQLDRKLAQQLAELIK